jgi:Ca-activated chloride channel family protein
MHLDSNDPQTTAYALGELDAAQQATFDDHVRDCEACRQAVAEIREVAVMLTKELHSDAAPKLQPAQRQLVEQRLAKPTRPRRVARKLFLALAASLLVAVGAGVSMYSMNLVEPRNLPQATSNANWQKDNVAFAPMEEGEVFGSGVGDTSQFELKRETMRQNSAGGPGNAKSSTKSNFTVQKEVDVLDDRSTVTVPLTSAAPNLTLTPVNGLGRPSYDQSSVTESSGPAASVEGRPARRGKALTLTRDTYAPIPASPAPTDNSPYAMPKAKTWSDLADRQRPGSVNEYEKRAKAEDESKMQHGLAESYSPVVDNAFLPAQQNPLSTFSIDVDTASYSNVRRMLSAGQRPPKDAVRIEELVNYFTYDYAPPKDDRPFSAHVEMADCPWHAEHRLVRIGLKGRDLGQERRPACNLVFLLDVSGSMNAPNKLPLVKESMRLLISRLNEEDNVAIVVYAGASGLALPSTSCEQKTKILAAIENLQAGGSTNGGAGIQLAYDTAAAQFIRGGVNRVVLCTDGDFNVGITSQDALTGLIQEKARGGVFLSVLGFGMGNLKDSTLEKLADLGNGNYAYIDSQEEARKVLGRQLNGTLVTIAKDVKIQVEFNPALVGQYRLIGYENRVLKAEDFNNDKKDAGEIGAGHTVTALYEIVPVTKAVDAKSPEVDTLKYQRPLATTDVATDEIMTLKLRYKAPDGDTSKLLEFPIKDEPKKLGQASRDFRFAAAVASFGMLLRDSPHKGTATWDGVVELAGEPISAADQKDDQADELKARLEFLDIVRRAKHVAGQ